MPRAHLMSDHRRFTDGEAVIEVKGATVGAVPVVISFFLACLLGSVIGLYLRLRKGQQYIPFGPFLSSGAILWIFARPQLEQLWAAYMGLFQG